MFGFLKKLFGNTADTSTATPEPVAPYKVEPPVAAAVVEAVPTAPEAVPTAPVAETTAPKAAPKKAAAKKPAAPAKSAAKKKPAARKPAAK